MFLSSRKYGEGCSSRIRILIYPSRIPDLGVKKAPDPGSCIWIRGTDHTYSVCTCTRLKQTKPNIIFVSFLRQFVVVGNVMLKIRIPARAEYLTFRIGNYCSYVILHSAFPDRYRVPTWLPTLGRRWVAIEWDLKGDKNSLIKPQVFRYTAQRLTCLAPWYSHLHFLGAFLSQCNCSTLFSRWAKSDSYVGRLWRIYTSTSAWWAQETRQTASSLLHCLNVYRSSWSSGKISWLFVCRTVADLQIRSELIEQSKSVAKLWIVHIFRREKYVKSFIKV